VQRISLTLCAAALEINTQFEPSPQLGRAHKCTAGGAIANLICELKRLSSLLAANACFPPYLHVGAKEKHPHKSSSRSAGSNFQFDTRRREREGFAEPHAHMCNRHSCHERAYILWKLYKSRRPKARCEMRDARAQFS
jgi:hypothetical protein